MIADWYYPKDESDKTTNAAPQYDEWMTVGDPDHTRPITAPVPAAPSAVAKIKEWERPRNGYKAMIDYDALYVEALDLAKRLNAQMEYCVRILGDERAAIDRAESAEAALKRKDGLLRRWLWYDWTVSSDDMTKLAQDTQRELDGKGE